MSTRRTGFGILLGSILVLVSACSDLPPAPLHTAVARSSWLDALPQTMSNEFCKESSPLRSCYPATDSECHRKVENRTVSCERRFQDKIPDEMQSSDMAEWGKQIGVCANDEMFRLSTASSSECQNALKSM